jgi:hypothetical protein
MASFVSVIKVLEALRVTSTLRALGTAAFRNIRAVAGTPCATDQVVFGDDPRLSDNRNPLPHTHAISNIINLQTSLDAKASLSGAVFTGPVSGQNPLPASDGADFATTNWVRATIGATEIVAGDGLTKTVDPQTQAITLDVQGTNNRISVTASAVDISSEYAGQTSIISLGTITTGVWQGTTVKDAYIASSSAWNAKLDQNSIINGGTYA